jgi:anti-sigma factor RsiW
MTFSDETLMAFADGELDSATRAAVEEAMREDPGIERRVAQHRAMREKVRLAYAAELDEVPPQRLLAAARQIPPAVHTTAVHTTAGPARKAAPRFRWQPAMSMAASLLIGVGLGYFVQRHSSAILVENAGGLVASGVLAKALSNQLSSERTPSAPVQIGLTFMAKSRDYCRTFTMAAAASSAGVACRRPDGWQVQVLAQAPGGAAGDESAATYRTAGSALSPVILDAVQQQIAGEPLDQNAEIAARQQGWLASGR